jgi:hypothetical protein
LQDLPVTPTDEHFPSLQHSSAPQTLPQAPQFDASVLSSTQTLEQTAPSHAPHFPATHDSLAAQTLPQPPQLNGSDWTSAH